MDIKSKVVVISVTIIMFGLLGWQQAHADQICIYYENTHQTFCWDN